MDPTTWERVPGEGRYARLEVERRFLVVGEPPPGEAERLIIDRYLDGLRLRLREVRAGDRQSFKLTQKVRVDEASPARVRITNVYLSQQEHDRLSALPGCLVVKNRRICPHEGFSFALDVFAGRHAGLQLAEVELDDLAAPLPLPPWLGREVTDDDRLSGGALAAADDAQLADLLRLR